MPDRDAERNKEIRDGFRAVTKAVVAAGDVVAKAIYRTDPRRDPTTGRLLSDSDRDHEALDERFDDIGFDDEDGNDG